MSCWFECWINYFNYRRLFGDTMAGICRQLCQDCALGTKQKIFCPKKHKLAQIPAVSLVQSQFTPKISTTVVSVAVTQIHPHSYLAGCFLCIDAVGSIAENAPALVLCDSRLREVLIWPSLETCPTTSRLESDRENAEKKSFKATLKTVPFWKFTKKCSNKRVYFF